MTMSPQEAFEEILRRRRLYYDGCSAVYGGDRALLTRTGERDSFWRRPGKAKLHVPVAADIASTSAQLLFGEEPRYQISCGADPGRAGEKTRRLNEIARRNSLSARLTEAAESAAALGEVFLKVSWSEACDCPIIGVRQADASLAEYGAHDLTGIHFFQTVGQGDRKGTVLRVWEAYEPGRVRMALFSGTEAELGTREGDSALEALGFQAECVPPVEDMLAVHIPNLRPNRLLRTSSMGRSDLEGLRGLMDALDEAYTSWMRDIRLGKSRLIVPAEYLRRRPEDLFREGQYTFEFDEDVETLVALDIDTSRTGAGIVPSQFAIRTREHMETCGHLLRAILTLAGYSPQTFGLDIAGSAESGTALHLRERRSHETRGKKATYWKGPLESLLSAVIRLDGEMYSRLFDSDDAVSVTFPTPSASDLSGTASAVSLLRGCGLLSVREGVGMVHPDWVPALVDEEVGRLEGEKAGEARGGTDGESTSGAG